jgi:hypothetical protein
MSATDRPDVLEVLASDHRGLEDLIRQLEVEQGGPDGPRKVLVDRATVELAWHVTVTRRYLTPLTRRALSDDGLADGEAAELMATEEILNDLEAKPASDPRVELLVEQLRVMVRKHIAHEEEVLFPELSRISDHEELAALGDEITTAKQLVAVQARPTSPQESPEGGSAGSPAGVVDRVRDALDDALGG